MQIPRGPGRSPDRQAEIIAYIQENIINKNWKPGDRIPTRSVFEAKFQASSTTIQRALAKLIASGFLVARGRGGTFVAMELPNQQHYALVVPQNADDSHNLLHATLVNCAINFRSKRNIKIVPFYASDNKRLTDDYFSLLKAVQNREFAGLIFAANPFEFENTPLLENMEMPKVAVMSKQVYPGVMTINFEKQSLIDRCLDSFRQKGCKKIAVIATAGYAGDYMAYTLNSARVSNLELPEKNVFYIQHSFPDAAVNVVNLLMDLPDEQRPDGLFVTDDNLTESVIKGVINSGKLIPEDVVLVSHCNFPNKRLFTSKVCLFGYNVTELLSKAIKMIDDVPVKGDKQHLQIAAWSEDEFKEYKTDW